MQINKGDTLLEYEKYYHKFTESLGLRVVADAPITDELTIPRDCFIYDVSIDGTFSTNETYANYTNFSNAKHDEVYAILNDLMARYPEYITKELLGNELTGLPFYLSSLRWLTLRPLLRSLRFF